jgi:hypothetical protein
VSRLVGDFLPYRGVKVGTMDRDDVVNSKVRPEEPKQLG